MYARRFIPLVVVVLLAGVVVAPIAEAGRPRCFGRRATRVGTPGNDRITGTNRVDVIVAGGGADTVFGRGGNDLICGGGGNDELQGMGGADKLNGGGGSELLLGQAGNDRLIGGTGFDQARYDFSPAGVTVNLTAGSAVGEGSDVLVGMEDAVGSEFDDALTGTDAGNLLIGLGGTDQLVGNGGGDYLAGMDGDDALDGGDGNDIAAFFLAAAPLDVNLAAGRATGEGTDTLTSMEGAEGGSAGDTLNGDELSNLILGGPGNDTIQGLAGDDILKGEDGTDTIDGGAGTDQCLTGETVQNCESETPQRRSRSYLRARAAKGLGRV